MELSLGSEDGFDEYQSFSSLPWVPGVQEGLQDLGILSGLENQGVQESLFPPVTTKTR